MPLYDITFSESVDRDLDWIAATLNVSKGEAFRRAISLMKAAVAADSVQVNHGEGQSSLVKIRN